MLFDFSTQLHTTVCLIYILNNFKKKKKSLWKNTKTTTKRSRPSQPFRAETFSTNPYSLTFCPLPLVVTPPFLKTSPSFSDTPQAHNHSPFNCHPAIFLQGPVSQTLMRRSSISVGRVSYLASLADVPLGLLKWLQFNVQKAGRV